MSGINRIHAQWLANEVALAVKHGSTKTDNLLRCLRKQQNLEETIFDVFEVELDMAVCEHHIDAANRRVFTDACNSSNLRRFLWDYMTSWNVPRFREFFDNTPTAQMYDFAGSDPMVAYGMAFHSPTVHSVSRRLVIYSIVIPCCESAAKWALRRRQWRTILDQVLDHIDAHLSKIVDGIDMSTMTKFIANNVFVEDAVGVTAITDLRDPTTSLTADTLLEDTADSVDALLTVWNRTQPTKTTRKSRRREKRSAAATKIQRHVVIHLRRKLCAVATIHGHAVGFLRRCARRTRAALFIQKTFRSRRSYPSDSSVLENDEALANQMASQESMDQTSIAIQIESRLHTLSECQRCLDELCSKVERLVEASTLAKREPAKDALQAAHEKLQSIQRLCGALTTVKVTLHGQVYQLHVATTSVIATLTDDGSLASRLIGSTPDELDSLFAPRAVGPTWSV